MSFKEMMEQHEMTLITQLLVDNKGMINKSARQGGIPKKTLIRKIRKYGISQSSFKDPSVPKSENRLPGIAKLNQLTRDGKAIILSRGHSSNRFHRDYDAGTAKYTCKDCSAELTVSLHNPEGCSGSVLSIFCAKK